MARAATWDGILPSLSAKFAQPTPADLKEIRTWMDDHRSNDRPYDVILEGVSPGNHPAWTEETLRPLAEAGATWWIESRWEAPNDVETLIARVRQGPPRL